MAKKSKPEKDASVAPNNVDLAEIERLLDFMQKHSLQEFEYEREGVHIVLKKIGDQQPERRAPAAPSEVAGSSGTAGTEVVSGTSPSAIEKQPGESATAQDLHIVKSPIVGTFYWAPGPEAEPFVTLGATVEAGQVLCIIEAMKLMNEIEADVAGQVAKIFVENGHPVEYGEPLFGIRPRGKR